MDPFTLHCTTCKARLIVKDESVIGDILACPKCGSMVQVVPPVGWSRPAGNGGSCTSVDSLATTAARPPESAVCESRTAVPTPPALPARASGATGAFSASIDVAAAASRWSALAARAKREGLLLGGALVGGVALGAIVWLVVAAPASRTNLAAAPAAPAEPAASAEPAANPSQAPATDVGTEPAAPPLDRGAASPAAQPARDPAPPTPPQVPPQPPAATESPAAVAESPAPPPASGAVSSAQHSPGAALRLDPIPGGADLGETAGLGVLWPQTAGLPPSANQATADSDAEVATSDRPLPAEPLPSAPAGPSAEAIEARLQVRLSGVAFDRVPLAQFATFVADVAGVPVLIDDAALAEAGKTRQAPVSLSLRETTAAEALRAAVARAGLAYTVRDGRIVITVAP